MCSSSALHIGLWRLQHFKEPRHDIASFCHMDKPSQLLWEMSAAKKPSMSSGKTWASMPKAFAEVARLIAQSVGRAHPSLQGCQNAKSKEHIWNGIN